MRQQLLQIAWQLRQRRTQRLQRIIQLALANPMCQQCLHDLFHLLGQQCSASKFDHLEGAVNLVHISQAKPQLGAVVAILQVVVECLGGLRQRFREISPVTHSRAT